MTGRHKERSPAGGPGLTTAFASSGLQYGHYTPAIPKVREIGASLAILAERHERVAPHELSWALWSLYDIAREIELDLRREGIR